MRHASAQTTPAPAPTVVRVVLALFDPAVRAGRAVSPDGQTHHRRQHGQRPPEGVEHVQRLCASRKGCAYRVCMCVKLWPTTTHSTLTLAMLREVWNMALVMAIQRVHRDPIAGPTWIMNPMPWCRGGVRLRAMGADGHAPCTRPTRGAAFRPVTTSKASTLALLLTIITLAHPSPHSPHSPAKSRLSPHP